MFDYMIADMKVNEKRSPKITELSLRRAKLNITLVFISQSHFKAFETIVLNAAHYFIMKILDKRELQEIILNYLPDTKISGNFSKIIIKNHFHF